MCRYEGHGKPGGRVHGSSGGNGKTERGVLGGWTLPLPTSPYKGEGKNSHFLSGSPPLLVLPVLSEAEGSEAEGSEAEGSGGVRGH